MNEFSKKSIYDSLIDAAYNDDNVEFLKNHRLLNAILLSESDGDVSEQARISGELFKLTKELIVLQGRGDDEDFVDSPIGVISLEDVKGESK